MNPKIKNLESEKERKRKQAEIQKQTSTKKLQFIRIVFIVIFMALGGVIIYEKIVFGDSFERRAIEQQIVSNNVDVIINPNRGSIIDKYSHSLAVSRTVYNIVLDVRTLLQVDGEERTRKTYIDGEPTVKDRVVTNLSRILEIEESVLNKYLEVNNKDNAINYAFGIKTETQKKPTMHQIIAKAVEKEKADEINKLLEEKIIAHVHLEEDTKRSYTNNSVASQLIGFMRSDVKWGLEKEYDKYLSGVEGRSFMRYNDFDSATNETINAKQGDTIVTTIDLSIQTIAEEIVNKAGQEYNPVNSGMIVMNPNTGEILSYAQYPNVNLNYPSNINEMNNEFIKVGWDELSEEEQYKKLNSVWKDFNAAGTFEPGSIYKPIVVSAALEEGTIHEEDKYFCGGGKYFGSTLIPCWNTSGHGNQTVSQVLSNSCNVGMMEIIAKLGPEKYYQYQRDFGFGERTGIDVPNEESAASVLHTLQQLNNPINLATNSMGQGFNSTAIQDIVAFSAVINGGNLMKPYVVSQIVDKDGSVVKENMPTLVRKVISKETSDFLRVELKNVVARGGTGANAMIKGYNIGGKTGTAQQFKRSDQLYAQSFIAYLTVENAELIAMAFIYLPEDYKKSETAPVTMIRELFLNVIKKKEIKPTGEVSEEDNIEITDDLIIVEDYTGRDLVDVSKSLNSYSFDFEFVGTTGTKVKSQIPIAGTKVSKKSKIYIYITTDEANNNVSVIPDVSGLTLEAAEKLIKESNLTSVSVESFYDEEITFESTNATPTNTPPTQVPIDTTGLETEKEIIEELIVVNQMPSPKIEVLEGTEVKLKFKKRFR